MRSSSPTTRHPIRFDHYADLLDVSPVGRRGSVHAEAEATVAYAHIDYLLFELELKKGGRPVNTWTRLTGTGRNDASVVWTLHTPYYGGDPGDTQEQPTGRCRAIAYDSFMEPSEWSTADPMDP
jgi:hypothetical protein